MAFMRDLEDDRQMHAPLSPLQASVLVDQAVVEVHGCRLGVSGSCLAGGAEDGGGQVGICTAIYL